MFRAPICKTSAYFPLKHAALRTIHDLLRRPDYIFCPNAPATLRHISIVAANCSKFSDW